MGRTNRYFTIRSWDNSSGNSAQHRHRDRKDDADDDKQREEQLPRPLQPALVGDAREREAAHDEAAGRGEEVDEAVGGNVDHDGGLYAPAYAGDDRGDDRGGQTGETGGTRNKEAETDVEYVVKQTEHAGGNTGLAERGDGGFDQPGAETGGGHDNAGGTSHRDDEVDGDHVAESRWR